MSMSPVCVKTLAVESNPLTRFADLVYADRGLSSFPAGIEEADCIEKFESHGPSEVATVLIRLVKFSGVIW